MIPKGLLTQIGMIAIAIAIAITYVKPAFSGIGEIQDQIGQYAIEQEKVAVVNERLQELSATKDRVSKTQQKRLVHFLPTQLDQVLVQRDLLIIMEQSGMLFQNVSYEGVVRAKKEEERTTYRTHSFTIGVQGTYTQLKRLLSLLEKNHYPLEVQSLSVAVEEGNFLSVNLGLATYEYIDPLVILDDDTNL